MKLYSICWQNNHYKVNCLLRERDLDLKQCLAAGGNVLHAGLHGKPSHRFFGQGRDRPAVGGELLNVQAMGLGCCLELVVISWAILPQGINE
jgi:hypothetical protein